MPVSTVQWRVEIGILNPECKVRPPTTTCGNIELNWEPMKRDTF